MSQISKFLLLLALIVFVLACNFIPQQVRDVQNLASTAESMASSMPGIAGTAESMLTSMPEIVTTLESAATSLPDFNEYNYFDPQGAPLSDWNGIPIMGQATVGQEFNETTYSFKVAATPSEVQEFFKTELVNLGWASSVDLPASADGGFMLYTKESNILVITITSVDGDTTVVLTLE